MIEIDAVQFWLTQLSNLNETTVRNYKYYLEMFREWVGCKIKLHKENQVVTGEDKVVVYGTPVKQKSLDVAPAEKPISDEISHLVDKLSPEAKASLLTTLIEEAKK